MQLIYKYATFEVNNFKMEQHIKLLKKIKEVRKKKGYSQEEIAKKLGISKVTYNRIENGKTNLFLDRFFQILQILGPLELLEDYGGSDIVGKDVYEKIKTLEKQREELEKQAKEKDLLLNLLIEKYERVMQEKNKEE